MVLTEAATQQVFLPGLVPVAALSGAAAAAPGSALPEGAARPGDKHFQEELAALLADSGASPEQPEVDAGAVAGGLPVPPVSSAIPAAESGADARPVASTAATLAGEGRNLPPGGKLLPPGNGVSRLNAAADTLVQSDATSLPESPAKNSRTVSGDTASQTSLQRLLTGLGKPHTGGIAAPAQASAAQTLTAETLAAETTDPEPIAVRGAAGQSAATTTAAQNLAETLRRLGLQPASRGGDLPGAAVETGDKDFRQLVELVTGRVPAAHNPAQGDSMAPHFGLHARSADSLLPAALAGSANQGADAVLRDLQNMMPLRPQAGEAGQAWSAGLGQRLLMMADNGVESARLRLSPAHLGPLEIHVNVDDDRVQVWFGAQHGQTRDALESSLPRLREMFAQQGLQLTQANVDAHQGSGGNPDGRAEAAQMSAFPDRIEPGLPGSAVNNTRQPLMLAATASGSLDIYV